MLITFLFWNINKKPLQSRIARIVATHNVDVVILTELANSEQSVVDKLNGIGIGVYVLPLSQSEKTKVFTRYHRPQLVDVFNDPLTRLTIRELLVGPPPGLILAVVHLVSKVDWDDASQALETTRIAQDVIQAEERLNNTRTIVVGDFNMNPFDAGVVGAQTFHAVMTKEQAKNENREIQGRQYRYFYNPMWGCFGDRTRGPAGTYYLHMAKPVQYFWNMYDQVLVRPALMDALVYVSILDNDGSESLITQRGFPRADVSDHLPIVFQLDI